MTNIRSYAKEVILVGPVWSEALLPKKNHNVDCTCFSSSDQLVVVVFHRRRILVATMLLKSVHDTSFTC